MAIRVTGVAEAIARMGLTTELIKVAAVEGLKADVTERVALPSQELVPLLDGPLQASMQVTTEGNTVTVSYGRDDDPDAHGETSSEYAVEQHENLSFNHAPGRQAKYLEQPGLEYAHGAEATLADAVRKRAGL